MPGGLRPPGPPKAMLFWICLLLRMVVLVQMSDIMLGEAAIYAAAGVGKALLSIIYMLYFGWCNWGWCYFGDVFCWWWWYCVLLCCSLFLLVVNYYLRMARGCLSSGSSKQEVTVVGGCLWSASAVCVLVCLYFGGSMIDTLFANVGCSSSACCWYTIVVIMMLLEWRIIYEEEMKIFYYFIIINYYLLLLFFFYHNNTISGYFHFNYDAVVIGASAAEEEYKKK